MIKILLLLIVIFGLISCTNETEPIDYFGQTNPDTIPVIFAPDIISVKGRLEHGISFSPDRQELAFGIMSKDDFSGEIYYSLKNDNNWSVPVVFEPLKNECVFLPYFTPDGKSMLFAKSKPDTNYDYSDIWMVSKNNGVYGNPERLNEPVSSFTRDANASMTMDGTIYLASNRACPDGQCPADIYRSRPNKGGYTECNFVGNISSEKDDESVFVSPDEDYIITCRYTNDSTWMDLYISYRNIENNWIEPQIVDTSINSTDWDRRPFVSIDNKYLFFTRLQIGEKGLTESDIFWVNTTKLFKPFVYNPPAHITLQVGREFELSLPADYFKDIDDKQLTLSINENEYDWLEFDSRNMKLSGLPNMEGEFELIFTAVDKALNMAEDKIKITVMK